MDNGLKALIESAAATGAPTNPTSRYQGASVRQMTGPTGVPVTYLAPRIVPKATIYNSTQSYTVVQGDRLDLLASRFLGDPALFWMIADANGAIDPWELTREPGRTIVMPVTAGIPPGARNG
jgi:nucleoid-associated protein YgaU